MLSSWFNDLYLAELKNSGVNGKIANVLRRDSVNVEAYQDIKADQCKPSSSSYGTIVEYEIFVGMKGKEHALHLEVDGSKEDHFYKVSN